MRNGNTPDALNPISSLKIDEPVNEFRYLAEVVDRNNPWIKIGGWIELGIRTAE